MFNPCPWTFRPTIRLLDRLGSRFRAKADLPVGFPYRFNSSFYSNYDKTWNYWWKNKQIRRIVVLHQQHLFPWSRSKSRSWHCANWKGLSHGSCMPNNNALSLIIQKIWTSLKFLWRTETDRRTDEWALTCPA